MQAECIKNGSRDQDVATTPSLLRRRRRALWLVSSRGVLVRNGPVQQLPTPRPGARADAAARAR